MNRWPTCCISFCQTLPFGDAPRSHNPKLQGFLPCGKTHLRKLAHSPVARLVPWTNALAPSWWMSSATIVERQDTFCCRSRPGAMELSRPISFPPGSFHRQRCSCQPVNRCRSTCGALGSPVGLTTPIAPPPAAGCSCECPAPPSASVPGPAARRPSQARTPRIPSAPGDGR
jgi:hypothetical protein